VAARDEDKLLRELYEQYAHRVYDRCRYLLRDEEEARDAMHDVFIKVQKNLGQFRGDSSPLTWMTRIATNHCLNLIRSKKAAWRKRYREEVKTMPKEVDGGFAKPETEQLLRLCLDRCDREVAEAAMYYFVDELTQAEISQLMGISTPTLRKRLRKFIELSRAEIERAVPGVEFKAPPI
jgi:RNA polymerase sigma-70 factor (ECF subfamily)